MPKTAPRKMTEDNAIIAISVVPIWEIFSWTDTPWIRRIRNESKYRTITAEFSLNALLQATIIVKGETFLIVCIISVIKFPLFSNQ